MAHRMAIDNALKDIPDVSIGLDVVEPCRGDEGADRCPSLWEPANRWFLRPSAISGSFCPYRADCGGPLSLASSVWAVCPPILQ